MGLFSIFDNIRKRGLKDVTNPERIKMYLDGEKIKKEGIHLSYEEILPFAEQLVFRSIVCSQCFREGKCRTCSCAMPVAAMVPKFECEEGSFTEMLLKEGLIDHEAWNKEKEDKGLSFLINYNR